MRRLPTLLKSTLEAAHKYLPYVGVVWCLIALLVYITSLITGLERARWVKRRYFHGVLSGQFNVDMGYTAMSALALWCTFTFLGLCIKYFSREDFKLNKISTVVATVSFVAGYLLFGWYYD
jgi:hypothetical protein